MSVCIGKRVRKASEEQVSGEASALTVPKSWALSWSQSCWSMSQLLPSSYSPLTHSRPKDPSLCPSGTWMILLHLRPLHSEAWDPSPYFSPWPGLFGHWGFNPDVTASDLY